MRCAIVALAAAALTLAALVVAGCGQVSPDDPSVRARAVRDIGAALRDRAYATGVDFDQWPALLAAHRASIDAATTADDFAAHVNQALSELGVSHLALLTPGEWDGRQSGTLRGIGASTIAVKGGLLVSRTVWGGPADLAGIKPGDVITRVDGVAATAAADLAGEPGRSRMLSWISGAEPREAAVTPAQHRRTSPDELIWLDGKVAVISVHSFSDESYDPGRVKRLFDEAADARGIVIDLRSNRGGNARNVEHLLAQVVARDRNALVDVYRENGDAYRRAHGAPPPTAAALVAFVAPNGLSPNVPPDDTVYSGPLAVLVDALCASGGELTPAVLQHLGRARIVGSRTRGKVRIGEYVELAGGFRLQVPIGEMVLADGTLIEGSGVQPDVELTHEQTARDSEALPAALTAIGLSP